jgi:hypothetical protein
MTKKLGRPPMPDHLKKKKKIKPGPKDRRGGAGRNQGRPSKAFLEQKRQEMEARNLKRVEKAAAEREQEINARMDTVLGHIQTGVEGSPTNPADTTAEAIDIDEEEAGEDPDEPDQLIQAWFWSLDDEADSPQDDHIDEDEEQFDEDDNQDEDDDTPASPDSWYNKTDCAVVQFLKDFEADLKTEGSAIRKQVDEGNVQFPVKFPVADMIKAVRMHSKEPSPDLFYKKEVSI